MIVLDASMAMAWSFKDERTEETQALLQHAGRRGAVVPAHWRLEVANAFRTAIRRERISLAFRTQALEILAALPIEIDVETPAHAWTATLRLSDLYNLTPYDAAYLELAQRMRLPLATLDGPLRTAAQSAAVELA